MNGYPDTRAGMPCRVRRQLWRHADGLGPGIAGKSRISIEREVTTALAGIGTITTDRDVVLRARPKDDP
jgi:hypothetical protein